MRHISIGMTESYWGLGGERVARVRFQAGVWVGAILVDEDSCVVVAVPAEKCTCR